MKLAFLTYHEMLDPRVMALLAAAGIDYYTRWAQATGKGHGTEPHLGTGSYGITNAVVMIAFEDESALARLIEKLNEVNAQTKRADDKIRLFQLPLERIV